VNIEEKKKIVDDLHERFLSSKVLILTDYKGLDVPAVSDLRRKLKGVEAEYKVVKNTFLKRASEGTDIELIKDSFTGPSAIAFSSADPVAPAKVLADFAREHKELEIQIGVLDGKAIGLNDIKALSTLPSQEILMGRLLATLNGVPTALVRALSDIPVRFLNLLQAIIKQQEDNA